MPRRSSFRRATAPCAAASTRSTPLRAARPRIVLPITFGLIFNVLLFGLYQNVAFPGDHGARRDSFRPDRRVCSALIVTGTHFSVSSVNRIPRALWSLGPDGGGLHLVRERIAARGNGYRRGNARGRAAEIAAHHDDRVGGGVRPTPCGAGDGSGNRFAAAVCAGDCRRAVLATADQRVLDAGAVRNGGAAGGSTRGVAAGAGFGRLRPSELRPAAGCGTRFAADCGMSDGRGLLGARMSKGRDPTRVAPSVVP